MRYGNNILHHHNRPPIQFPFVCRTLRKSHSLQLNRLNVHRTHNESTHRHYTVHMSIDCIWYMRSARPLRPSKNSRFPFSASALSSSVSNCIDDGAWRWKRRKQTNKLVAHHLSTLNHSISSNNNHHNKLYSSLLSDV